MKTILWDIETFPNLGYTWGKYEQNVIAFKEEWKLAAFGYKVLEAKRVHCVTLNDVRNESALVRRLHEVLSDADILVAHNGDSFDMKKANAKFIEYGLKPPTPSLTIDTKKVARRHFAFNSNSLDALGELLGVGRKVKTGGFDLWLDCMAGKQKAWDSMARYNKQDVVLLEEVYLKLRPWIKSHPRVGSIHHCPNCGSHRVQSRGVERTKTRTFKRFQCQECGAWSRGGAAA